jgi:hypothetical protein
LIWLVDIAGLSRTEAVRTMRWSARAMLDAALADQARSSESRGRG